MMDYKNYQIKQQHSNKVLIICVVLLFFVLGFAGGYFLSTWEKQQTATEVDLKKEIVNKSDKKDLSKDIDFNVFWQVWDSVSSNYIEQPVDEVEMFYGALTGMAASLGDPHTVFLDPEVAESFNDDINGSFSGIGAEIGHRNDNLVVIAPLPQTPADQAGLKAGDIILAIDGVDATNIGTDYAVELIRGERGTVVKLLIKRNAEETLEIPITRDTITVDSVKWEMKEKDDKKIAYINITNFNTDTITKFNEAISDLLLQEPEGLILDLRNDPGGLLDQAIEVASVFVPEGPVVYEEFRDGTKKEYKALGNAKLQDIPTVVLVNAGSASASEIVAGALQDYGLATLVGEVTFGKGSVQSLEKFSDGSSLKMTVAHWLTPKNRMIQDEGIEPDEIIKLTKEDYEANNDVQLNRALEILSGREENSVVE